MTEERMLVCAVTTSRRNWAKYSGLCSTCGEVFYSANAAAIVCSKRCLRGELGNAWSGGRRTDTKGYVQISGNDTHPRKLNRGGYVYEHTLVMEKHLGRYLTDGENVHHKNGIKTDNRIDNLELWTSYQPYGQRVEDLLDFVVKNYPDKLKELLRL